MINILNRKKSIELGKTEVFLADADFEWNKIEIYKGSLICTFEDRVYINEMPLTFFTILDRLYVDKLSEFKNGESFVFSHSDDCSFNNLGVDEKITIRNGSLARWHVDHFCYSGPPNIKSLDHIPNFKYKNQTYSSWGFQFNIITHEIEGAIYKENGKYYEMTNGYMSDWEIKS